MGDVTHAVYEVKDEAHGDAELFKVEVAIVVDVGEVPDFGELVFGELRVFEDGCGLGAGEVGAAAREGREDFPVALDFPLFYLFV